MPEVRVTISKNQADKIRRGHPIQLSRSALSGGNIPLVLHPENHKKVMKAKRLRKGVRLQLSPSEIDASGEGLKELLEKGKKFIKEHGPQVRKILTKGLKKAIPAMANAINPGLAPAANVLADRFADDLVDFVGDKTGAFGLGAGVAYNTGSGVYIPYKLENGQQTFLNPAHPAMWPQQANLPNPGEYPMHRVSKRSGGSFLPAGGSFRAA